MAANGDALAGSTAGQEPQSCVASASMRQIPPESTGCEPNRGEHSQMGGGEASRSGDAQPSKNGKPLKRGFFASPTGPGGDSARQRAGGVGEAAALEGGAGDTGIASMLDACDLGKKGGGKDKTGGGAGREGRELTVMV